MSATKERVSSSTELLGSDVKQIIEMFDAESSEVDFGGLYIEEFSFDGRPLTILAGTCHCSGASKPRPAGWQ